MSRILSQILFDLQSVYSSLHTRYIDVIAAVLGYIGFLIVRGDVPLLFFMFYIVILAELAKPAVKKLFPVRGALIHSLFGALLSWNMLVTLSSVVVVFGAVSVYSQAIIGILVPGLLYLLGIKLKAPSAIAIKKERVFFKKHIGFLLFILILLVLSAVLIVPSGAEIVSPWQVTPQLVQYMALAGFCVTGLLVYSQYSSSVVLVAIMGMSLFTHMVLPLSHIHPWGGDAWRMIGQEQLLVDGNVIEPVLFGAPISTREILGLPLPDVFFVPHKYTYAQMWSSVVIIANHSGYSLEAIHRWLLPILWSIVVPLLTFLIGMRLFSSRRYALFFSWITLLPFTLQVLGAISLPNGLGFVYFLFVLYLLIVAIQEDSPMHPVLLYFLFLSGFGYALYAVILWFLYGTFLVTRISTKKAWGAPLLAGMFALGMALIPLVDVATGYSQFSISGLTLGSLGRGVNSFFGITQGLHLSAADIPYGNIFYNQLPGKYLVPSLLSSFRYHIPVATLLISGMSLYGAIVLIQKKQGKMQLKAVCLALLLLSTVGYAIGWGLLKGDVLFTRRLDPVVAFAMVLFAFYGGAKIRSLLTVISFKERRIGYMVLVACCSWFGATVFAIGPDIRSTSAAEYGVGTVLAEQDDILDSCFIASTESLLVLEAKTGSKVVGGNFPIDYQFGQPERVALFTAAKEDTELFVSLLPTLFEKEAYSACYLALPIAKDMPVDVTELLATYGEPKEKIQDVLIWKFEGVDFFSN